MKSRTLPRFACAALAVLVCALFSGCAVMDELYSIFDSGSGAESVGHADYLYQKGCYEEAIASYEKALEAGLDEGQTATVYKVMGSAYDALEEPGKAIECYQKSIETEPGDCTVWTNLGVSYRVTGEYEEAEKAYLRALEIDPHYANALISLGVLYVLQTGRADESTPLLERAIEEDPTNATAYGNLAYCYALLGRIDEATQALEKARELGYENADYVEGYIAEARSE